MTISSHAFGKPLHLLIPELSRVAGRKAVLCSKIGAPVEQLVCCHLRIRHWGWVEQAVSTVVVPEHPYEFVSCRAHAHIDVIEL